MPSRKYHSLDEKGAFAIEFMRRAYFFAQQGRCGICRNPLTEKINSGKTNFDHVWPVSKLGCNYPDGMRGNILLIHASCNAQKADDPPTRPQVEYLNAINRALGLPPRLTAHWDIWTDPVSEAAE